MGNKVELLSPAGNKEAYFGAVHAGADAIYLGGEKYGARAYADNFTTDEIIECIRYGHMHGCKTYLTVNTLVKETELRDFVEFLVPFYQNGLDGVIVQDLGACALIHAIFPDMELHISTQMTITGSYGADYVKELGAVRVVPARECSLYDIENMKKNSDLEIESFIHGAMCYCYSGQCLFSSVLGERSGNRGRCAGPCRLPYKILEENGLIENESKGKEPKAKEKNLKEINAKDFYPLSLKDMCTVEKLPRLIMGGIDSFKIEGRMKKPEYSAGVTAIYRKYIDLFYKLQEQAEKNGAWDDNERQQIAYQVSPKDLDFLKQLYIRSEIQDGYYFKHNGKEMITMKEAGYKGSEPAVLEKIRKDYLEEMKCLPVKLIVEMIAGQKVFLKMSYGDLSVTMFGDVVEKANQKALSVDDIRKQFSKMGNTFFMLEDIDVITDLNSFYPVKSMNLLRREAVQELENKIIQQNGFSYERTRICMDEYEKLTSLDQILKEKEVVTDQKEKTTFFSVEIQNMDQVKAMLELDDAIMRDISRVYIADYLLSKDETDADHEEQDKGKQIIYQEVNFLIQKLKEFSIEVLVSLPVITAEKKWSSLEKAKELTRVKLIHGVLVKNLEQLRYLTLHDYAGKIYSDANLYMWNSASLQRLLKDVDGFTYPYELSRKEERTLFEKEGLQKLGEKIVYGRIPLMTSANCLFKTSGRCKGKGVHYIQLKDRMNVTFPVRANCHECQNTIYNSVPLSLHKDMNKKYGDVLKRIIFTTENKQETTEVLRFYFDILHDKDVKKNIFQFTSGYDKEGVL